MQPEESMSPDLFQPQLGRIFAEEMQKHCWSKELEPLYSRLRATNKMIYEVPDGDQSFSAALWDVCFNRLSSAELWHYTTLEKLANIVRTQEIWLHPLSKRMGEGELKQFSNDFEYLGLLAIEENGYRRVDNLARDLFFLSLTDKDEPGNMWYYGEVRLRLKITPTSGADLRRMTYSPGDGHPLQVIKTFARTRFGRAFIPSQVSRQGAFVLSSYYSWESEVRLLVKRFDVTTDLLLRQSPDGPAIAIPIGKQNSRAQIDLVRVEAETAQTQEKVGELIGHMKHCSAPSSL